MKNKFWKALIMITTALALTSCSAAVVDPTIGTGAAIGTAETISGLRSVVQGLPGTMLYQLENQVLMAWPKGGTQYAFAVMQTNGAPVSEILTINGKAVSTYRMVDLVKALESSGWKAITPGALPALMVEALTAYTVELVALGMQSLPSVIVVPMLFLTPYPEVIEVQG